MTNVQNTFHPYGATLKLADGNVDIIAGDNIRITPAGNSFAISAQIPPNVLYSGIPWQPPALADAKAPKNSVYFSTDATKLVYKGNDSVVHNLY